jgi:hypothetical protein
MRKYELGEVVHIYNSSTQKAEAGGQRVPASLGCIVRLCLKKPKGKKKKKKNPKKIKKIKYIT